MPAIPSTIRDPHRIPVVLPHYQRRQNQIFFLVSRRETVTLVDAVEAARFDAIDGTRTIAELENSLPGISDSIERWARAGIVKLVTPLPGPASGPHAVVIEPHMDDAILSVGGRLLNRSGRQRSTILSLTRWSSYTSYLLSGRTDFSDVATVTELRTAESRIAARLCGASFQAMEENDSIVEMGMPLGPDTLPTFHFNLHGWGAFGPTEQEVTASSERLLSVLRSLDPDELWIPMGLGPHLDHVRTRQACLRALLAARSELEHRKIFLYRDLPYARQFPLHADIVLRALGAAGAKFVRRAEDITDVFEDKLNAVSVYASQWKVHKVRGPLLDDAQCSDRIPGLQETYYEMTEFPRYLPRVSDLSFDQPSRSALATRLDAWFEGAAASGRVNVLLPLPPIRCDLVFQMLRERFPRAKLCVFALPDYLDVDAADAAGIAVREVPTIDEMDEIQSRCELDGEWTLVLGGDPRRRRRAPSDRCLIAPSAGLVYMLSREASSRLRESPFSPPPGAASARRDPLA